MATWQKTFYIELPQYDKTLKINDVSPVLDKLLKRDWSGESVQCWGHPDTNDILVTWDKETNEIDDDIRVRVDLRELDIEFIQKVIKLTRDLGLKLKVIKTETFEPELSEIARILADSNADKFTADPKKFLDDFEKGLIKPE
jgi:hypothetical protein